MNTFDQTLVTNIETGGDEAYDQSYWSARNPVGLIKQIVRDKIPAFLIGGWYDLFQRGELLNYSSFQNAFAGRPVLAPMSPAQPVTPRYQLIQGPWYHVTAGNGLSYHGLGVDGLELAWFDHWLKGTDTGITNTATPLHLEDLATGKYADAKRYPLDEATPTTYYLHPGGGLSPAKPPAASAADTLVFTGSQIPCTGSTEQWAAGLTPLALSFFGIKDPCTQNASLSQIGPGTQNYTTAPFAKPTTLAGPIGATLYAATTTTDAEWVVQLSDVAPDGTATSLTSGLLEGNQRSLNAALTWPAPDGKPLLPWHPYTKSAQKPISAGEVTRFDVEVFPDLQHARCRAQAAGDDRDLRLPARAGHGLAATELDRRHLLASAHRLAPLERRAAADRRRPHAAAGRPHATRLPEGDRPAERIEARPGQARDEARRRPCGVRPQLDARTGQLGLLLHDAGRDPGRVPTRPRGTGADRQQALLAAWHPRRDATQLGAPRPWLQGWPQHLVLRRRRRAAGAARPDRGDRNRQPRALAAQPEAVHRQLRLTSGRRCTWTWCSAVSVIARSAWRNARSEASGASASGRPSAATRNW